MTGLLPALPPAGPEPGWGQSLYSGAAGIALAYIEQARSGTGDWGTARQWVREMTREPVSADPGTCGLHHGAPAVAFVLRAAGQPAYDGALDRLDQHVTTITWHRLRQAQQRIDAGQRPALAEYDLIRGLTGLGACLIQRPGPQELLRAVLEYLIRLTEPVTSGGLTLPGWWTGNGPSDQPSSQWPGGHANLGMAHGICGPLTLMSISMRRGIEVPGQADAMRLICAWLDDWRASTSTTAWWPGLLSLTEYRSGTTGRQRPQRPSWCYGTPGLARAQQLAGLVLSDPARQRAAEKALAGCVADDAQLARLGDTSLCHGWAGLIHTTSRVAADAADPVALAVPRLARRMRAHMSQHGQPARLGLLEGGAGLQLAQHASWPPLSGWDTCLLLNA